MWAVGGAGSECVCERERKIDRELEKWEEVEWSWGMVGSKGTTAHLSK